MRRTGDIARRSVRRVGLRASSSRSFLSEVSRVCCSCLSCLLVLARCRRLFVRLFPVLFVLFLARGSPCLSVVLRGVTPSFSVRSSPLVFRVLVCPCLLWGVRLVRASGVVRRLRWFVGLLLLVLVSSGGRVVVVPFLCVLVFGAVLVVAFALAVRLLLVVGALLLLLSFRAVVRFRRVRGVLPVWLVVGFVCRCLSGGLFRFLLSFAWFGFVGCCRFGGLGVRLSLGSFLALAGLVWSSRQPVFFTSCLYLRLALD